MNLFIDCGTNLGQGLKSFNKKFKSKIDLTISAISGLEGLKPTLEIIKFSKRIAIANKDIIRRDSYSLKPGLEIRIPTNIDSIIENFEKINKIFVFF